MICKSQWIFVNDSPAEAAKVIVEKKDLSEMKR